MNRNACVFWLVCVMGLVPIVERVVSALPDGTAVSAATRSTPEAVVAHSVPVSVPASPAHPAPPSADSSAAHAGAARSI